MATAVKTAPRSGALDKLPKISRLSVLILMVGIFVIVMVALLLLLNQQKAETPALQNEISNLRKIASGVSVQLSALREEVAAEERAVAGLKSGLPVATEGANINEQILKLSQASDVHVTKISAVPGEITLGSYKGKAMVYTIALSGEGGKIQGFISSLRQIESGNVSSVSISPSGSESVMDVGQVVLQVMLRP